MIRPDAARPRGRLYRPFFETVGQKLQDASSSFSKGRRQAEGRAVERGGGRPTAYQVGRQGQCQEGDSRRERTVARSGTAEAPAGLQG